MFELYNIYLELMVEIVEMALIPYCCCLLGVGTIFLGYLTTRGEPESVHFPQKIIVSKTIS